MKESIGAEPWEGIRKYLFKRKITGNLGEIVETEDKIFVFVDKKKIKKRNKLFGIICSGIKDKDKEKARKYDLDKPICYIFKNLEISNPIEVYGKNNCEIIIGNCKFNVDKFYLNTNGRCSIIDTTVEQSGRENSTTISINARELLLKNTIIHNDPNIEFNNINIYADKKIEISNSSIDGNDSKVFITTCTGKLEIYKSKIKSLVIEIATKSLISSRKSCLEAKSWVSIIAPIFYEISINSPEIKSNNSTFENITTPVILKREAKEKTQERTEKKQKRLELLRYLNSLKDIALENIQKERIKVTHELSNKPITKVLSKEN